MEEQDILFPTNKRQKKTDPNFIGDIENIFSDESYLQQSHLIYLQNLFELKIIQNNYVEALNVLVMFENYINCKILFNDNILLKIYKEIFLQPNTILAILQKLLEIIPKQMMEIMLNYDNGNILIQIISNKSNDDFNPNIYICKLIFGNKNCKEIMVNHYSFCYNLFIEVSIEMKRLNDCKKLNQPKKYLEFYMLVICDFCFENLKNNGWNFDYSILIDANEVFNYLCKYEHFKVKNIYLRILLNNNL